MTTCVTGRYFRGPHLNAAIRCALLCVLALVAAPKTRAEEAPASSAPHSVRTLDDIAASVENGRLAVTLEMNRPLEPTVLEVENPPRLVLDFTETVNRVPFKKLPLNAGPVKGVRVSQFRSANPAITRVVFDLENGFGSHRVSVTGTSIRVTFAPEERTSGNPAPSSIAESESRGDPAPKPAVDARDTSPARTVSLPVERELSNRTLSEIGASHEDGNLTVTLKMSRSLEPSVLELENPPRLVLDFSGTENRVPFKKLPLNSDPVQAVRVSQYRSADPAVARVVFDLGDRAGSHRISLDGSSVRVTFLPAGTAAGPRVSSSPMTAESTAKTAEASVPGKDGGLRAEPGPPAAQRGPGQDPSPHRLGNPSGQPASEEKTGASARSGSPREELPAAETDAIKGVQTGSADRTRPTPMPDIASNETPPGSGKSNSVNPAPPLTSKSGNEAVPSKPVERPASAPAKEPVRGDEGKKASSAQDAQASSEKLRESPEVNARRAAGASQASRGPVRLSLAKTLDRIGASVEQFRKNFKSIACTELVSQTKLGKRETVIYKKDQEYEYMIFTDIHSEGMSVEESRVEKKTKGRTKDLPLLVTKGFPTLLLIFHPFYQGSFKYKLIGEETVEGRNFIRIDFKQIKGRRSTSILNLKDKNYPLELEGTAWIDPESYNIQRIKAGLIQPMESVGLETFNSDVLYVPMNFTPDSSTYWMPQTATVEVMTKRQHWRNVHQFEDYRLFSISSESEISIP